MNENIVQLLARAPRDQSLWLELYNKMRPTVFLTAYKRSRSKDMALDITQATFERLVRYGKLDSFESDRHLAAFLRTIALNLTVDTLRREQRTSQLENEDDLPPAAAMWPSEEDNLRDIEADLRLLESSLEQEERLLLSLLLSGRSLREIADRLGLTYGAAAARLHRLKNKLSRAYKNILPRA